MSDEPWATTETAKFETAAAHVITQVPMCRPGQTIGEVRRGLLGKQFACANRVIVCEQEQLRGVIRLETLLAVDEQLLVDNVMDTAPHVVRPGIDQEVAARNAVRAGESDLLVVDDAGRFQGVIPAHALLTVLLAEHEEDLSRLGGFTTSSQLARTTSEEAIPRRFRHRVPWLLVGLGGALAAADFVGFFESKLQGKVILAFFLPGIVYLADAVGTQTETVVVRGLSVGVPMKQMVFREIMTGLAIGIALSAVTGPVVWWRWGQADVALCVALAVLAACSSATVSAMLLPWCLDSLKLDPAFGSGPLATVIQDLLSIVIYFGIAMAIVK